MDFNELSERDLQTYIAQNVMLNQALLQTILLNQAEILAHLHKKPQNLVVSKLNEQVSEQIKALSLTPKVKSRVKVA